MSSRLFFLLVALAAALCLVQVQAQQCGFGGVDLTALSKDDVQHIDESTRRWVLRPCAPVADSQCRRQGSRLSTCMVGAGAMAPISYGDWGSSVQWSYIESSNPSAGIQMFMKGSTGASGCNYLNAFYSHVKFPCAASQGELQIQFEPSSCYANYTLPTPLACGAKAPQKTLLAEF